VIKTKFLKTRIIKRKNKIPRTLFHKNFFSLRRKNRLYITIERERKVSPSRCNIELKNKAEGKIKMHRISTNELFSKIFINTLKRATAPKKTRKL
jgi:hypothetical protein